jgi:chemotaxis family two-component system response regulator Rcp1
MRTDAIKTLLLVEDSAGDARLTSVAFQQVNPEIDIRVVTDGIEAMEFLHRSGNHANAPRPEIILLDLNLPMMDGREVLARIKGSDDFSTIPTVILTTSDAEADILSSYEQQANCYLIKPVELGEFEGIVRSINDFWLTRIKLPETQN